MHLLMLTKDEQYSWWTYDVFEAIWEFLETADGSCLSQFLMEPIIVLPSKTFLAELTDSVWILSAKIYILNALSASEYWFSVHLRLQPSYLVP